MHKDARPKAPHPKIKVEQYTCRDAKTILRSGKAAFIYAWAGYQSELSMAYKKTRQGMSSTPEGKRKKAAMLAALDQAIATRASHKIKTTYSSEYRGLFEQHLEDPGTYENFRFFEVPSSDEMIMFYASIWSGYMGRAMGYLHLHGRDLSGHNRPTPKGSWYTMVKYEGIAGNEHKKARAAARRLELLTRAAQKTTDGTGADNLCFFGGGILPQRFYGYLAGKNVVNFEIEPIDTKDILTYPSKTFAPAKLTVFQESLLSARAHTDLAATQDFLIMYGVSMYLGKEPKNMVAALENAAFLLRQGGVIMFDNLIMTPGMLRTATAQHWPGADKMLIFNTPEEAAAAAIKVVEMFNASHSEKFSLRAIKTNTSKIWGPTSVCITLVKQ